MSVETVTSADPYAHLAASYDRLAAWVVAEQEESPRDRIADFLESLWRARARPVRTVLEICCGTGLMLAELVRRGYVVTGLDRSPAMLEQAGRRLGDEATLIHAELPRIPVPAGAFDAVISAAGGLNYLSERQIDATFGAVARALPPGGTFVFDVFGKGFYDRFFDSSTPRVMALELDDVAYIWTFTAPSGAGYVDMVYTQFSPAGGTPSNTAVNGTAANGTADAYVRTRDLHRYYPLPHATVRRLADAHGFASAEVHHNYSAEPSGPHAIYDTWTLTRGAP